MSDADRDDVVDALRQHCVAGRLSVAELDDRVATVYAARTEGQLDALLNDLPGRRSTIPNQSPTAPLPLRGLGPPGLRPFMQCHEFNARREQVFANAECHIVPEMLAGGYDLAASVEPTLLVFKTSERPAWVPALCVLAFPVGLLSLRVRQTHRIVVAFEDATGGGTHVTVRGVARRAVRRAFSTLSD